MTGYRPDVEYMFNMPSKLNEGGFFIDVDHNVVGVTSLEGKKENQLAFMMNSGVIASAMEHGIMEQIFQIPGVSSIKILTEAANRGIEIYSIGQDNIQELDEIQTSESVKKDIRNAAINTIR